MVVAGQIRRIVFSEKGVVVATHPPRSTPITTTGLRFKMQLGVEGVAMIMGTVA
jgi:hypothetical protein